MNRSIRNLDNYLSVYKQGGRIVAGREKVTLDLILKEETFDVKNMVRENKSEIVAAFYVLALKELWMNSDNTFTNDSITSCALFLMNTYENWNPKEIVILLRNGMNGKYGKTFGKINTMEVMRWAKEYDEVERTAYFENRYVTEEVKWQELNPEVFKGVKIVTEITKEPEPKKHIVREKTPQEKLIQDIMRDFDKSSPFESGGKRWVKVDDKTMDINEYIIYRLEQFK